MHVHRRRLAIGAALVGALALTLPSIALAIGTLDQEQAVHNAWLHIDSDPITRVDQEFTAGATGTLDTVSLYLSRPDTLDATFHVEIRDPILDTSLASGTAPAADVPTTQTGGWVEVSDWGGAPATVTAGTKYVIRVEWLDTGNGDYSWAGSDGETYAGGDLYVDDTLFPGADMAFRTYVTGEAAPTATPIPSALPTPTPNVTVPPTATLEPAPPADTGGGTIALFAILAAVASGTLVLAGRRSRS